MTDYGRTITTVLVCMGCNKVSAFVDNFWYGTKSKCCGKHIRCMNLAV